MRRATYSMLKTSAINTERIVKTLFFCSAKCGKIRSCSLREIWFGKRQSWSQNCHIRSPSDKALSQFTKSDQGGHFVCAIKQQKTFLKSFGSSFVFVGQLLELLLQYFTIMRTNYKRRCVLCVLTMALFEKSSVELLF
jgi:hypothetical protein